MRQEVLEKFSFGDLLDEGLVRHLRVSNQGMERMYAGSDGAGLDEQARKQPQAAFIDLYVACVSLPSVAHSLLTEDSLHKLKPWIEAGDQAMRVISSGRHRVPGDDFARGGVPERMLLRQDQMAIDMRDLDLDLKLLPGVHVPPDATLTAFRVSSDAELDPGAPFSFSLPVTRLKGQFYPERITRELHINYRVKERLLVMPPGGAVWHSAWHSAWRERRADERWCTGKTGTVQNRHHAEFRASLAVCGVCGGAAGGWRFCAQILLPLSLSAGRLAGTAGMDAPLELDTAPRGMRPALPDMPPSLRLPGDPAR